MMHSLYLLPTTESFCIVFRTFHFIDIYFIFKECQRKESEKRRERSDQCEGH